MVDVALQSITQADVVCAVVDATEKVGGGDEYFAKLLGRATVPVVLALNKIDAMPKAALLPMLDQWSRLVRFQDLVPVSALTGENEAVLEEALLRALPEGEPLYPDDYLTDQPDRAYVAEIIREKVLRNTRDELPFSSAVLVDRFEEPDERGLLRLFCTILVERESQKPIVIGRGGAMIKRIGTEAREELERFFNTRIYLDLRVKTSENWREDPRRLDELGVRDDE
jgi:GTP-binding protein Era